VSVDPDENQRAAALYRRLGYVQMEDRPREEHWCFTDSSGVVHQGTDWVVETVHLLPAP
jgi:hypothetical protein